MAAGGLLHLWKEWGIQVMVLASLALQVLLLALGEIRRRSSSAMLSIALWLAYLSADSTAIYALGHLSVASTSREHQLVAFWAPFLLLHLGGPDNITAYSLEDNKLWLRHLQTLVVQVLGATYVIYLYMTGSGTLLLLATISMFAVGLTKYGERTWALKCSNISSIAGTVDTSEAGIKSFEPLRQRASGDDEEDILLAAHSHFNICKGAFTDVTMKRDNSVDSGSNRGNRRTDTRSVIAYLCRNLYKVVEMELSLMYDILYTKAAVIHTWYGFCVHSISLLGTSIGFLLFQLSINSSRGDGNISYRRADVVISYVLLAGALVVETTSVCRALLSTWTCSFLYRWGRGCKWLLHVITSLRRRVQPASRRLWLGSIGQYGLLHLCSNDRNGIGSRLANKVGLQDWWNRLHFSSVFSGTDTLSMEELKMGVLGAIMAIGTGMNSRGSATLVEWIGPGHGLDEYYSIDWSVNIDLYKSILVWHIATNMHIRWASRYEGARLDKKLVEATKVLSNYMMFLLVVKPDMLPGRTRPEVYLNACKELDSCWHRCSEKLSPSTSRESLPRPDILADWLANLNDGLTKLDTVRGRTNEIFIAQPDEVGRGHSNKKVPEDAEDVYNAVLLFRRLWYGRRDRALAVIFKVWVEMMLYVAEHCSRDSHSRQLSNGGEFITIVWLVVKHLDYYSILQDERRTMLEV